MKKIFKGLVILSFLIYIYVSCYVLFIRFGGTERLAQNQLAVNLVPFRTIIGYINALGYMRGHAIINLGGNLFLLFPLGFYLPFFARKMQKVIIYSTFVLLLIIAIESIQLISMTGTFDVDDFILNFTGAILGFFIFRYSPIRHLFKVRED